MAGEGEAKSLEETPTWAVATVCLFLMLISMFIEHWLHLLAKVYINIYTHNLNLQHSEILDMQLRIILISIHLALTFHFVFGLTVFQQEKEEVPHSSSVQDQNR
jgi:hypothetical protein